MDIRQFSLPSRSAAGKTRGGLIQRLDNETSGLIIAARNTATLKMLRRNVTAAENFDKVYLALCIGTIEDEILLNKPIAHHPRKKEDAGMQF